MKIERVYNPNVLAEIEQDLIFYEDGSRTAFMTDLVNRMVQAPESIFFLVVRDGDKIIAFTITRDPGVNFPFVYIAQAWSKVGNPWSVINELVGRIYIWAELLGKTSMRAESTQGEAMFRRFGFKIIAQVVSFQLTPAITEKITSLGKDLLCRS